MQERTMNKFSGDRHTLSETLCNAENAGRFLGPTNAECGKKQNESDSSFTPPKATTTKTKLLSHQVTIALYL